MTWDVFVSYASEDKNFARRIALGLESAGLRVWFDETALEAGDSLRRAIDTGLKDSRYGVVILSTNFFKKEWPQRELDGLTAREDDSSKVIIPVWYKISVDDVRKYSPILADKFSIYSSGSANGVATKIVRAIEKDRVGASGWTPAFTQLSGGTELVVLPIRPVNERAICIGRYPVLNREYQLFVDKAPHREPIGEHFENQQWKGPFVPWKHKQFSNAEQPVVCVTFRDAISYCRWLGRDAFLPPVSLWDFAASGRNYQFTGASHVNLDLSTIHHRSSAPAVTNRKTERDNALGVSDMFGNVWEWVNGTLGPGRISTIVASPPRFAPELRGGGYLDDLATVVPFLHGYMLDDGMHTSHSDLGFRIATTVPLTELRKRVTVLLKVQPFAPDLIYESIEIAQRETRSFTYYDEYY